MRRNSIIAFSLCMTMMSSGVAGVYQGVRAEEGTPIIALSGFSTTNSLSTMDESELINDLREKLNKNESVDIGMYAALLIKRKSDRTIELLKEEITDGNNSEVAQTAFYDILNHLILSNDTNVLEELKGYIDKKEVCTNVKARIINEWLSSEEDVESLAKRVSGKNKKIAYYSLKRLYELDATRGLKRAGKLLNKSANSSNKKMDAARYIVSDIIRNTTDTKVKEEWLDKCIGWFGDTQKSAVRQKWVYALSFMNDKRALEAIVSNGKVSAEEKQSAIYENKELTEDGGNMTLQSTSKKSIGKIGCAIFRDGVLVTEWHSAIVTSKKPRGNVKKSGNIVHAPGPNKCVKKDTWNSFLDGNRFKGFFKANEGTTKEKRVLIAEMAKKIAAYDIPYCFLDMMQVKEGVTSESVLPEYISALRCDGVVEYCYEYYGLKLQGDDEHWDITQNTKGARRAHSMLYSWVSPKIQSVCMKVF